MYTLETPNFLNSYSYYQPDSYNSGSSIVWIIFPILFGSIILILLICGCTSGGSSVHESRSRGTGQGLNTYISGTTYQDWGMGQDIGGYSGYQSGHCSGGHYAGHHDSHSHGHHGGYSGHDSSSPSGFDGGCSGGGGGDSGGCGGGGGDGGC
ncbi:hypothetical protein CONCODRAFT_11941 [Conidiobolus coronatus NRRL 28638]|uniref:Uncharacterized protein n=1 Tax=Conidiobolus coronatus (strain ATCC 28846 / CBS 209.66 / NRRL 28638) TaxID=796925 RepID=A0A137NTX8_CONC2|nr:hypothetical protein CONCODRAFT_11941 [Conidiobolus coronatus NRRL 28638]|eukprot:KXN66255.1 hypothetical protein CONCODRAFT_11941 [Conidiobolus coronatus NRRL 28638]